MRFKDLPSTVGAASPPSGISSAAPRETATRGIAGGARGEVVPTARVGHCSKYFVVGQTTTRQHSHALSLRQSSAHMGCCSSKAKSEWDEEEVGSRRNEGNTSTREYGDTRGSSNARVQAWREEAIDDDVDDEVVNDVVPMGDPTGGGSLEDERAGKWASKAAKSAMKRAFRDVLGSGKYTFDRDKDNALSARKLGEHHPQARGNPLAYRIFNSFSKKKDGGLRAEDWQTACIVLHPTGSYPNKAKAGFQAYDANGDGCVDQTDLVKTLRSILGNGVSERQVFHLVDQLKKKFDKNDDGILEEKEFANLLTRDDIEQRFTMDLFGKYT